MVHRRFVVRNRGWNGSPQHHIHARQADSVERFHFFSPPQRHGQRPIQNGAGDDHAQREREQREPKPAGVTGWAMMSSLVGIKDDAELDLAELKRLLLRVQKTFPKEQNRVRNAMNGFVIAVGTYVQPLSDFALQTAQKIGEVSVDVGDTSCKVPYAPDYIEKVKKRGAIGKKRKTAKC